MQPLAELCAAALARPAAEQAVEFEGRWVTWGEMRRVAEDMLEALEAAGARGKIAFAARNRPSALAAFLGLLGAGHGIRMLYPFQSAAAMARELRDVAPAALVADAQDLTAPVLEALQSIGAAAVALGPEGATARHLPDTRPAAQATGAAEPPAIEILTSGTTGPPKPFAMDYDTIGRHIVADSALPPELRGGAADLPPSLLMFPLSNISGLYSTLPPLLAGQRVILLERFTVEGWHDFILRFRPQVSGMPPAGVQMVLDADIPPADLACLQALGTGAAPLDPGVKRAFEERYGVPIILSYGATEFGGPVARMTPELLAEYGQSKFDSVGRALPGMRLRIVDPESGEELPPGTEGILEVVSHRVGEHWIRTSDIAVIDADGFLFHRGRADGAIMRGGFKLLPATVEHALLAHPAISHACVVGLPDRRLGQVPAAALQLAPGAPSPTVEAIEAHLRERVPATHIPAHWRIVEALPRTPSMKIDLPAVRRLFEPPAGTAQASGGEA